MSLLYAVVAVGVGAAAYYWMFGRRKVLDPSKKIALQLIEKENVTHDVLRVRFALPSSSDVLGLPVCKHVFVSTKINGKLVSRTYTPVSSDDELGFVELMLKVYHPDPPKFPNGGALSQHINNMHIGDTLDFRGPMGKIEYMGCGTFHINAREGLRVRKVQHIGMIAGGTGITPILQLVRAILKDPNDHTKMSLIFANKTEDDIFLRQELENCASENPSFKLHYTLDSPPPGWGYSAGFIDEDMIRTHMPCEFVGDAVVVCCGPPPMIQYACKPNLEKVGFKNEDVLCF